MRKALEVKPIRGKHEPPKKCLFPCAPDTKVFGNDELKFLAPHDDQ